MKTVIFDLDGTLANVDHRRRLKGDGSFDWKYFNDPENMIKDKPNSDIIDLYRNLKGKYSIAILTGRMGNINDSYGVGKVTREWLFSYLGFNFGDHCLMRNHGDFREDSEVKQDMLNLLKDNFYDIAFSVDDRQQVVDMWRRNGITCLQCAPGNF